MASSRSSHVLTIVGRARLGRRVHPHVERRVGRVREAALGPVDLHRRDAEIEQDRVRADAVRSELRQHDREVAAQEAHLDPRCRLEAVEVRLRARVAVDRDELAPAREVLREEPRVPAGAEGCVDDRLPGPNGEELAHLVGENGDVIRVRVRQDVRQHVRRSLRRHAGAAPRRLGSTAGGGRSCRPRRPRARGRHGG